jgi:hypothetical protein
MMACSAPPLAAVSLGGKRRKGKVMTPEQEDVFREKLKALSPAELEMLRHLAQSSIMKAHKVTDDDGKKVPQTRNPYFDCVSLTTSNDFLHKS